MTATWTPPSPLFTDQPDDPELETVVNAIRAIDPSGDRFGETLRQTFDQLYDGQHTGRYAWEQLRKTEKTHMGTLVEIALHRAFDFGDGDAMDYRIAGIEVDCKFSQRMGGWEIPPEAYAPTVGPPHLCLVVTASDIKGEWIAGVVRVDPSGLRRRADGSLGTNRDNKVRLAADYSKRVRWLWGMPERPCRLPENILLHLSDPDRARVLTATNSVGRSTGQSRINALFEVVQRRVINRGTILTVAQQDDGMKRARDARLPRHLGHKGILVLGHQENDPLIARDLALEVPRKGSMISVRVVPAADGHPGPAAEINGQAWRVAQPHDPVVDAPQVHRGRDA
ncbi:MAG: NaeI family type II restriction endonuclease [Solirubrobacteraceae bacterium]|nr:NaeI family type II restriction endonuclease [Solirubrobacteraceae bacterium]